MAAENVIPECFALDPAGERSEVTALAVETRKGVRHVATMKPGARFALVFGGVVIAHPEHPLIFVPTT